MQRVQDTIEQLPQALTYLILFFTTFLENIFPPFPGDTFTLIGAYFVGTDILHFWITYLVTTLGSISGFLFLYILGLKYGRQYFLRKDFRYFSRDSITRVEKTFQKRGVILIALNRFMSGFRAVVSLVAGIAGYDWRIVFSLGIVSCLLWNGLLIYAGSAIGENWQHVVYWIERYNLIVFTIVAIAGLIWTYFNLYVPAKNAISNKLNSNSDY